MCRLLTLVRVYGCRMAPVEWHVTRRDKNICATTRDTFRDGSSAAGAFVSYPLKTPGFTGTICSRFVQVTCGLSGLFVPTARIAKEGAWYTTDALVRRSGLGRSGSLLVTLGFGRFGPRLADTLGEKIIVQSYDV
eukprot:1195193-Prorocentrum_minimum.AAC.3